MQISYKAVYSLFDEFYIRRSLQGYINDYIRPGVFNGSLLMAHQLEDYQYLTVMVEKRDVLGNRYIFFVKDGEFPIVIERDKDLSVLRFALLYSKSTINVNRFEDVVAAQAFDNGISQEEAVGLFTHCCALITGAVPVTIKENKEADKK